MPVLKKLQVDQNTTDTVYQFMFHNFNVYIYINIYIYNFYLKVNTVCIYKQFNSSVSVQFDYMINKVH